MISGNPFGWTNPSSWPWFVYVWLALIFAGWLKPVWRWYLRQRASSWPTASGQIEYASVSEAKRFFLPSSPRGNAPAYVGELGYSFSLQETRTPDTTSGDSGAKRKHGISSGT